MQSYLSMSPAILTPCSKICIQMFADPKSNVVPQVIYNLHLLVNTWSSSNLASNNIRVVIWAYEHFPTLFAHFLHCLNSVNVKHSNQEYIIKPELFLPDPDNS